MTVSVVVTQNLGNEFDLGVIEAGKIHVKLGSGLTRDPVTGEISFDAGVLPDDVNVQGLNWDPVTNELTLTETDGSSFVVDLGVLAADKFLSSSSFDPVSNVLTLVMTDGSEYQVDLADLVQVQTGVGIKGDGTSPDPLAFEASALPVTGPGDIDQADMFLMATDPYPDGSRVAIGDAAEQVLGHLKGSGSFLAALEENLVVDVQDAFGTHLYFALP
jgi:hypothetical protein